MDLISAQEPNNSSEMRDVSFREWIDKRHPRNARDPAEAGYSTAVFSYARSAIPLALKLTECLVEAEAMEQNGEPNPVPLKILAAENVRVTIRDVEPLNEAFDNPDEFLFMNDADLKETTWDDKEEDDFHALLDAMKEPDIPEKSNEEIIEKVQISSRAGEPEDVGSKMSRLFALGSILYELFSGQIPKVDQDEMNYRGLRSFAKINEIDLNQDPSVRNLHDTCEIKCGRNSKKYGNISKKCSEYQGNLRSRLITQLGTSGIPHSLCFLTGNLLDCSQGDFCGDDAYRSFSDVRSDLQLMIDDPSRFLDDIDVSSQPLLSIDNKLYGREKEIARIDEAYKKRMNGDCKGVLILGEPGVGKSKLAMHTKELTMEANGYFISGKFDQSQQVTPLSVVGSAFDQCCDKFARDGTHQQKQDFATSLQDALGDNLSVLLQLLPSLSKILPLITGQRISHECVDSSRRVRYMFCTLVQMLSFYLSMPITLFLDDLQWADPSSLLLIRGLLGEEKISEQLFLVFCARESENGTCDPLFTWQRSISIYPIEEMKLRNLDTEQANKLTSDALRLSPRLTLRLSLVLHHKTRGNPLFLRRILESLKQEGHLYFSLKFRRWMWDIDKIADLKIADDVVTHLMKEMKKMSEELQLGLKVAACMGMSFDKSLIGILSKDVKADLRNIFPKILEQGFIDDVGTKYRFVHDRIQQAAYEIMSPEQQQLYHLRFGLAICANTLDGNHNDEIFFLAMNQINRGGPRESLSNRKKSTLASLNLKAGKRSIVLSDFHSAFKFFEHGISILSNDHWANQYDLSLEIFEEISEAACVLHNAEAVKTYSDAVLTHGRCFEDKLSTLHVVVKSLTQAGKMLEAERSAFNILSTIGEEYPPPLNDDKLQTDIQNLSEKIDAMTNDSILNLKQMQNKKSISLMKLYHTTCHVLGENKTSQLGAIGLRMIELTLSEGLCSLAPIAFASFGVALMSMRKPANAYRMGSIALQLLDKLKSAGCGFCKTSDVIIVVHHFISWTSEPFQSISEAHIVGYKAGKQSGDVMGSTVNYLFFLVTSFFSGHRLTIIKKKTHDFVQELTRQNEKNAIQHASLLHLLVVALVKGPDYAITRRSGEFSSISEALEIAHSTQRKALLICANIYHMIRMFFFRKNDDFLHDANIMDFLLETKSPFRIHYFAGIFFEGLVTFSMARQTGADSWMSKGNAALSVIKWWSKSSPWNFSNKVLLLEAEKMFALGKFGEASASYEEAILLARKHKFIHEEAISCELAGRFYHEINFTHKSIEFLTKARDNYNKWGAKAVASQVDLFMEKELGLVNLLPLNENEARPQFATNEKAKNKRQASL